MNIAARDSSFEAPAYLGRLNDEQRLAVMHGDGKVAAPLLVIAGAGSGKTNTLAHRVAHLIVKGADPRRLLLLTFTRRAAAEMIRRVERICAIAFEGLAQPPLAAIDWAGTFHAMGAQLLRQYADAVGLSPGFSVLDRGDAADLMNLVREERGLSRTDARFPRKDTCLGIYSYTVNARR